MTATTKQIVSSDGVGLAVHDLGGAGPPLLVVHATGFHSRCYAPLCADSGHRCWGLDVRGHGASPAPVGWQVTWSAFGQDTIAAARSIAPDGGLTGFGHSMGAAALLIAAHQEPGLFDRLVLFEPIAYPPAALTPADVEASPLVQGARRRRLRFDSLDDAFANYKSKPPMSAMTTESLRLYVDHGFRSVEGGVELRCAPDFEAETFLGSRTNGVWELLPDITTNTTVVSGVVDQLQPSGIAERIADMLPNGRFVEIPHLDHFGPFTHPRDLTTLIRSES